MKILFTGGGTGGHFYPIIAIAEALLDIADKTKLVDMNLYYAAPTPYDATTLFKHNITYKMVPGGKLRKYASFSNITDTIKTAIGIIKAFIDLFFLYPDVVVGKGGYGSFPVLLAARFFRIPIIIHESDSIPGKVNRWAGKFASRIAISYPEAAKYFPKEKVALTGNPIRKEILESAPEGAKKYLDLEDEVPVILVLGGSQGAQNINNVIVDALPELVEKYQILHQTGDSHIKDILNRSGIILEKKTKKGRYHPFNYFNDSALRIAAGATDLIISRAGSTIFEIAAWGIPSIIIPLSETVAHDQKENAFTYARSGAAHVVEDENLTQNVLLNEIEKLLTDIKKLEVMGKAAKRFSRPDAAEIIAKEVIRIAKYH